MSSPLSPSTVQPDSRAFIEVPGLPTGLDAVFVIHASKFTDRRQLIEQQLEQVGLPFEFVLDFDATEMPDDLTRRFFANSRLSPSQQSCALKHWKALSLMVERNIDRALILEDDVILSKDFRKILLQLIAEEIAIGVPHVTFLGCGGHYYIGADEIRHGQLLYLRNQGKFADSYILSRDVAERRLTWIAAHGIARPIDHLFEQIDRDVATAMYWLEPPIVEQGSHNGTFGSSLESSYPLWFQSLQFRWKKMWRRRRHK